MQNVSAFGCDNTEVAAYQRFRRFGLVFGSDTKLIEPRICIVQGTVIKNRHAKFQSFWLRQSRDRRLSVLSAIQAKKWWLPTAVFSSFARNQGIPGAEGDEWGAARFSSEVDLFLPWGILSSGNTEYTLLLGIRSSVGMLLWEFSDSTGTPDSTWTGDPLWGSVPFLHSMREWYLVTFGHRIHQRSGVIPFQLRASKWYGPSAWASLIPHSIVCLSRWRFVSGLPAFLHPQSCWLRHLWWIL